MPTRYCPKWQHHEMEEVPTNLPEKKVEEPCSLLVALTAIVYGGFIILGFLYSDACPAQPLLPCWLILFGVCRFFRKICGPWKENPKSLNKRIIDGFLVICFLIETFLVFQIYPPNHVDVRSENYCHEIVYKVPLFHLVLLYICIAVGGFAPDCDSDAEI